MWVYFCIPVPQDKAPIWPTKGPPAQKLLNCRQDQHWDPYHSTLLCSGSANPIILSVLTTSAAFRNLNQPSKKCKSNDKEDYDGSEDEHTCTFMKYNLDKSVLLNPYPSTRLSVRPCLCPSVTKKNPCFGVNMYYGVNLCYGAKPCYGVNPCYGVSLCYDVIPCYGVSPSYGVCPYYGLSPCFGISPCYGVSLCHDVSPCYNVNPWYVIFAWVTQPERLKGAKARWAPSLLV